MMWAVRARLLEVRLVWQRDRPLRPRRQLIKPFEPMH